ncbi:hypothetical protein [Paenibacillus kobensis]|uniref:hypothetical protein n=1 Tax=Paenibacillus kobensis TaxID=59841 RepID=UPI000FDCC093|nr:hypothetical protein [Paenibacillus kobensis]
MFELHDIIPYLFSISVLCSFAYVYFQWSTQPKVNPAGRERLQLAEAVRVAGPIREWASYRHELVRKVKRKEAPDEDASDCQSSNAQLRSIIRGGKQCKLQTRGSLFNVVTF